MGEPEPTGGQYRELLALASRLTPEEFTARKPWLAKLTDPEFDPALLSLGLPPPFKGAILHVDSPDSEPFDVSRLQLVPILRGAENAISAEEAMRRGQANPATNWGQRAVEAVWAARGSIPKSAWPVGQHALFIRTIWRDGIDDCFFWYVFRGADGWRSSCYWCHSGVGRDCRFPALGK